jgi:hypothetical protein
MEALARLDERVQVLLPAQYQDGYADVSPTSMEVWTTFCDLALAGGPPHRGTLLEPVDPAEVAADPVRTAEVTAEIDRAIGLTSGFAVRPGDAPGWIAVICASEPEATWLQFAITAENVSARRRGRLLQLPAGPAFRVEKEIKNVVVALAKTSHYWDGHLTDAQQGLLVGADAWEPVADASQGDSVSVAALETAIRRSGLHVAPRRYSGWIGAVTDDESAAAWLLRAVLVTPILARREESVLYLPVLAERDVAERIGRVLEQCVELHQAMAATRRNVWRPSGPTEPRTK